MNDKNLDDNFFIKKGLCGMTNLGNTCFLNSILQCINNTKPFTIYVLSNEYKESINKNKTESKLFLEWEQVSRQLWNKNSVVTPSKLLSIAYSTAIFIL